MISIMGEESKILVILFYNLYLFPFPFPFFLFTPSAVKEKSIQLKMPHIRTVFSFL